MANRIFYSWSQQMDSYHPDFSIQATFEGWANIKGSAVDIETCKVRWDGSLAAENVSVDPKGGPGSLQSFFLAKCRESAREAYQKIQDAALQAEISEDLKSNHHHNADFWPKSNVYATSLEDMANTNGGGGQSSEP